MSAPLRLAVAHQPVNDEAVVLLEDLLGRVKRAEVNFVMVLGAAPDGSIFNGWTGGDNVRPYTVLGALSAMSHNFAKNNIE